jgi:GNAT superfamily N-acetyltransferase
MVIAMDVSTLICRKMDSLSWPPRRLNPRPGVYLELFVTHAARGKGVGRRLMTRLAAIAVERGWERIDFQVLDWNPARGFYRRIGIEHLGDWLRYGGDAGALRRLAAENLPDRD